jgi:hypothetical protein
VDKVCNGASGYSIELVAADGGVAHLHDDIGDSTVVELPECVGEGESPTGDGTGAFKGNVSFVFEVHFKEVRVRLCC